MKFSERFSNLPAYAFPRLRSLLDPFPAGGEQILMTIGEPRHPFPDWVGDVVAENIGLAANYPPNEGSPELLEAITGWIARRYDVAVQTDHVMALNGTREGLYNAAMALCPEPEGGKRPVVLIPNPFYQVYAVAAAAIGAEPVFVPATEQTGFLPDYAGLPADILDRTEILYLCSPSNPQGAVASRAYLAELLDLAMKHDFRIFADECYAEIYRNDPPPGILQVAKQVGADPERALAFHSLSKRSNLPGLRSGFVAGGAQSLSRIRQLRAYCGAPLPGPLQPVAARAWSEETHVEENRALYREKFDLADQILGDVPGYLSPTAGFFLWLPVADGEEAAIRLWRETGVKVLPGAYLSREVDGANPGQGYIRVALVAPRAETERGLTLIRDCLYT